MMTERRLFTLGCLLSALVQLPAPGRAATLSEREQKRQETVERCDRLHLRAQTQFVVERSDAFLRAPDEEVATDFSTATAAPTVKLQILPDLIPEFFSGEDQYMACWANWAYVSRSPDNRFFFAASDHLAKGCSINLYEYRPGEDHVRKALDVDALLGWTADTYTDGKIHVEMGIMPDGTLWGGTHYGVEPTAAWYEAGYRGGWLFSYDIHTGAAKNWGVPLVGNDLAVGALDPVRGRYVATGAKETLLCWDVANAKVRFAGYLPDGWVWWVRSMLCDQATGKFWGMDVSEEPYHFISYDPELNRFDRYDLQVPENPISGKQQRLRGHTAHPDPEGWYYWSTLNGAFFRFRATADGPLVEPLGVTWDEGRDVLQMALDPSGRYVYFQPKSGHPERSRSPIVQYDIETGKRKALCYFQDHIFEKYGYWCGGQVYGLSISADGSFLVIVQNGAFTDKPVESFGHPSLTVVAIPESER